MKHFCSSFNILYLTLLIFFSIPSFIYSNKSEDFKNSEKTGEKLQTINNNLESLLQEEINKLVITGEGICSPYSQLTSLYKLFPTLKSNPSNTLTDDPIIFFECMEHDRSIGVFLFNYLFQYSCSQTIGSHFLFIPLIDVDSDFDIEGETTINNASSSTRHTHHHSRHHEAMMEAKELYHNLYTKTVHQLRQFLVNVLPKIVVNTNLSPSTTSKTEEETISLYHKHCSCHSLLDCLRQKDSAFNLQKSSILSMLEKIMNEIESYVSDKHQETIINIDYDEINIPLTSLAKILGKGPSSSSAVNGPSSSHHSKSKHSIIVDEPSLPSTSTASTSESSSSSSTDKVVLPLIPDVSIYYHCNNDYDSAFESYGFLSFPSIYNQLLAIIKTDLQPSTSSSLSVVTPKNKYIYILSECGKHISIPTDYKPYPSTPTPYLKCSLTLQWLYSYLIEKLETDVKHHQLVMVVKRNSNYLLDFLRLKKSRYVISSLSSFSFLSLLLNTNHAMNIFYPTWINSSSNAASVVNNANIGFVDYFHPFTSIQWIPSDNITKMNPYRIAYFTLIEQSDNIDVSICDNIAVMGGGKSVYVIKNKQKHEFNSGSDFEALGYSWSEIWKVRPDQLNAVPLGPPVVV
jgi:hypothetical protein